MLILIAHGSRDGRWRASVEEMVGPLQQDLGADRVRIAYMDLSPPTLLDVASEAVRSGATTLRVLPLFFAAEGHVERDVAPLVEEVRRTLDGVEVTLLPPVGQHPEFRDALRDIARRTDGRREGP
ncbi:MAG: CbiX/SirB N-terminal domain-containing protein [Gemmatimonadota bacterium]|jgi:sirohydrochlorin cobaltochelatase